MTNPFLYRGVDTVRFKVFNDSELTISENIDDPQAIPKAWFLTPGGDMLESQRIVEGVFTFEVSAYRYYGWDAGSLADETFLKELSERFSAKLVRIDLAAQIKNEVGLSVEDLSYCRYYGRRSLQKKRQPWAYWPGQRKTVKFYDKVLESGTTDPKILGARLRLEIEFRNQDIPKAWNSDLMQLKWENFNSVYSHITVQATAPQGLTNRDYRVLGMLHCGIQPSRMNYHDRKSLPVLDMLNLWKGGLNE